MPNAVMSVLAAVMILGLVVYMGVTYRYLNEDQVNSLIAGYSHGDVSAAYLRVEI